MTKAPPTWFKLDEYRQGSDPRKNPRTREEWLAALSIRRQCAGMLPWVSEPDPEEEAPPLPPEAVEVDPQAIWQNLCLGDPPVPAPLSPVQDITNPYEEVVGECIVRINLAASDKLIVAELSRLLKQRRESYPDPYRRRGRRPLHRALEKDPIEDALRSSWVNYRILALFDLWLWHILFKDKQPTWMEIGAWLYPDRAFRDTDLKQRARDANRTLARALNDGINRVASLP